MDLDYTFTMAGNNFIADIRALIEGALGNGPYFFGDDLSMLDIYVWMLAQWPGGGAAWLEANCPNIVRRADTVKLRPRIAPIHEENFGA